MYFSDSGTNKEKLQEEQTMEWHKKEIVRLIEGIEDSKLLEFLYRFIARTLQNREIREEQTAEERYRKEILNLVNRIQSKKFLKFLRNLICSFKKEWGY